jgi:hypothetical protein
LNHFKLLTLAIAYYVSDFAQANAAASTYDEITAVVAL